MTLKAKPVVGQVWVWTCVDDTTQMFLITQIKGDICKGIILFDNAYYTPIGEITETYTSKFTYGRWILVT